MAAIIAANNNILMTSNGRAKPLCSVLNSCVPMAVISFFIGGLVPGTKVCCKNNSKHKPIPLSAAVTDV